MYMYDSLIFDLISPKSTQFIGSARYIQVLSLMVIHPSVLMIMRSQAIFAYIMSPMTFDLMAPKSNQFIASSRYMYIHVLSFMVICPSVLMIMWSKAIFAYIMSPVTFDLWPFYTIILDHEWYCLTDVRTTKIRNNLNLHLIHKSIVA